jgi:hypothetical protein
MGNFAHQPHSKNQIQAADPFGNMSIFPQGNACTMSNPADSFNFALQGAPYTTNNPFYMTGPPAAQMDTSSSAFQSPPQDHTVAFQGVSHIPVQSMPQGTSVKPDNPFNSLSQNSLPQNTSNDIFDPFG